MKKILFIIVALLAVITTKAQITITQADFGNINYHAIQANDTLVDTAYIHIGNPSALTQTWVFDSLRNDYTDVLQFMTVASTPAPFPASFGAANIAYTRSNSIGTYNFGNSSSSGVTAIGLGLMQGTFPISTTTPNEAIVLNTPQTYINFPSTYGAHFMSSANAIIIDDTTFVYSIVTVDTLRIHHTIIDSSMIDAWGIMNTPVANNVPVLRQKFIEWTIDTIDAHTTTLGWQNAALVALDSSLTYRWFANGQGFPIVEITMNKAWTQDSTADYIVSTNTGVPQLSNNNSKISLYPNPASTELNIMNNGNETSYLFVYDVMGRLIDNIQLKDKITTISTSDYANGLYTYRVLNADNIPIATGKFNIIK